MLKGCGPARPVNSPLSTARRAWTLAWGQSLRLARVRFLIWPASRQVSRRRMAGRELRLGTRSTNMDTLYHTLLVLSSTHPLFTWIQPNGHKSHFPLLNRLPIYDFEL